MTLRQSLLSKLFRQVIQPASVNRIFIAVALILPFWIIILSHSLPPDHLARRWNWAWVGLDVGECISLALSGYFGLKRSGWLIVTTSIAGTLLLVDAWFDILSAGIGWDNLTALMSALFVELPLAALALFVAWRTGRHFFKAKF